VLAEDTIAAISTPPGEGAIAVIRVSGPDAIRVAESIFRPRKAGAALTERVLHFGSFYRDGEKLDEGLLAVFAAPRSYTGENMAEIHGHGGALVSSRLYEAVLEAGARAAEPGEFTQRAFINGKMDLTQAEAVMDVIRASTPRALKAAQEQLRGRLGDEIEAIRARVLAVVAHLEAYIDFPEEGIDPHVGADLLRDITAIQERITALLDTAEEGRILREGVRLVLCGAPNAGKSSLLNRLLGFERAIVSAIPGTTRDTIEEFASLHGLPFRITDTAGLRETDDVIEREGVERARRAIENADVIVRVIDATETCDLTGTENELVVFNKVDLLSSRDGLPSQALPVSCTTGEGIRSLVDAIVARTRGANIESPTLAAINARHQSCLIRARKALAQATDDLTAGRDPELVALPLREALQAVGEVVGLADTEEILGEIFSTFCIGK